MPDPFEDYRMWYVGPNVYQDIRLTDHDIHSRLWDYNEFRQNLDLMRGTVLLQRFDSSGGNSNQMGWRIAFAEAESGGEFYQWFHALKKEYRIETSMTTEQFAEMEAWIKTHIQGPRDIQGHWSNQRRNVVALIKDPNEAMEFKMRWYKIAEPEEEDA
ncbi:MAG: hypothetical protein EOP83_28680 [Verrucomicrobiaceae bacterium]|nr:MAG: hypothetical protein EOP83_28680 [Verrucomicrobiaceae bacterium]